MRLAAALSISLFSFCLVGSAQSVTNGDFEGGLTGWTQVGNWSASFGSGVGGSISANNLEIIGGHNDSLSQTITGINAGETWRASAFINGAPSPGNAFWGWYTSAGAVIANVSAPDMGGYSEFTVDHTFTPSEVSGGIQVRYAWVNGTGSMNIDNISISQVGDTPTPTSVPTATSTQPPASRVTGWQVYR